MTRPDATAATPTGGTRAKTVLTEVGPVELAVPRDRESSLEPRGVRKRQRRLTGVEDLEDLVISLVATGLTTGEVQAHLAKIDGPESPGRRSGTITDRVLDGMTQWQSRPLDPVSPVIFVAAIETRSGVRSATASLANRPIPTAPSQPPHPNRPIYVALGVNVDGERDILRAVGR